jgi:hypothetical protein
VIRAVQVVSAKSSFNSKEIGVWSVGLSQPAEPFLPNFSFCMLGEKGNLRIHSEKTQVLSDSPFAIFIIIKKY